MTAAPLGEGRHPSSRKAELERTHSDLLEWLQAESCATRRRHFFMSVSQTAAKPRRSRLLFAFLFAFIRVIPGLSVFGRRGAAREIRWLSNFRELRLPANLQ